jgi:hypothetical protein
MPVITAIACPEDDDPEVARLLVEYLEGLIRYLVLDGFLAVPGV